MIYKDSKFIYPPRPEYTFQRSGMDNFDNGVFMAQPKFNGSCSGVYIGTDLWKVMNRHKLPLTVCKLTREEVKSVVQNTGSNVIIGEYMNKSQKDESGKIFNHKLVIFDILVHDSEHLIGKSFIERYELLQSMFDIVGENDYTYRISDNIFLTKTFFTGFGDIWDRLTKIDMIEGLVLKRKDAGLEPGITEKNNVKSQLKCRKPTKNYMY